MGEPEAPRRRLPLALILAGLLALGGLGAAAWFVFGPGVTLERTELEDGGLGTQRYRLRVRGSERQSPEIYTAPELVGSGLSGRSDGTYRISWSSNHASFLYRVEVRDEDDALVLTDPRETLVVEQTQVLLLTGGGAVVLEGHEADDLLPVLANPRIYFGFDLVNSAPKGAKATDEAGLVAGTQVRVAKLYPGSPADKAGFELGDVLVSVDLYGKLHAVRSRQTLATWWALVAPGNEFVFEVRRGEQTLKIPLKTTWRGPQETQSPSSVSDDPRHLKRH